MPGTHVYVDSDLASTVSAIDAAMRGKAITDGQALCLAGLYRNDAVFRLLADGYPVEWLLLASEITNQLASAEPDTVGSRVLVALHRWLFAQVRSGNLH